MARVLAWALARELYGVMARVMAWALDARSTAAPEPAGAPKSSWSPRSPPQRPQGVAEDATGLGLRLDDHSDADYLDLFLGDDGADEVRSREVAAETAAATDPGARLGTSVAPAVPAGTMAAGTAATTGAAFLGRPATLSPRRTPRRPPRAPDTPDR